MTETRVALVTGSSRGIGAATALALARSGCDVVVNYVANESAANGVTSEVTSLGRRALAIRADVGQPDDCKRLVDTALKELGRIDVLVNNAGTAKTSGSIADGNIDDFAEMFARHVIGPAMLCKLVVPQMRNLGRGDVIMVSSLVAQRLPPRSAPYNTAKAAMEALALTLAKEERASGIRVNIVSPGLVQTDMGESFAMNVLRVKDMKVLAARSPFGMVCQASDIASAIAFLCSEGGRFITGERLTITGGNF